VPRDDDRGGDLDWLSAQFSDDPIVEAPAAMDASAAAAQDASPPTAATPCPVLGPNPALEPKPHPRPVADLAPEPVTDFPQTPEFDPAPGIHRAPESDLVPESAPVVATPNVQTPPAPWWTTPMVSAWAPAPAEPRRADQPATEPVPAVGVDLPQTGDAQTRDAQTGDDETGDDETGVMPQPLSPPVMRAPLVSAADAAPVAAVRHSSGRLVGIDGARSGPLFGVLVGIAAVIVLVGLFFVGQRLGAGAPVEVAPSTSRPTITTTPVPTAAAVVTAIQPPGLHEWNVLFGGECVESYASPWDERFTVIDCAIAHAAQLVYRGSLAGDTTTAFPGEAELAAQVSVLCSAGGVIDLTAAAVVTDAQVQGTYPVTNEQWATGDRHYYCFVSRSSGEPLIASLAGPGPTA